MSSPSLPWIVLVVLALLAGVVGGLVGGLMSHRGDDETPVNSYRPLNEERQLIQTQGDWQLRRSAVQVQPKVLQLGAETLVYIPRIRWKSHEKLDVDYQFYRLEDGGLTQVSVTELE